MEIQDAIKILLDGSNTHFDKKITDVFLSLTCDKIINVLTCDFDLEIALSDKLLLEKYKFGDLYAILLKQQREAQEETLIQIFNKYYNYSQN